MCGSACIRISDCCCGVGLRGSAIWVPRADGSASNGSGTEAQTVWNVGPLLAIIGFDRASPPADTLDQARLGAEVDRTHKGEDHEAFSSFDIGWRDRAGWLGRGVRRRSGKLQDRPVLRRGMD